MRKSIRIGTGSVAALAAVVVIAGLALPSRKTNRVSGAVSASQDATFACVGDLRFWADWEHPTQTWTFPRRTTGVGGKARINDSFDVVISSAEPGRSVTVKWEPPGPARGEETVTIERMSDGVVQVTIETSMIATVPIIAPIALHLGHSFSDQEKLERLKRMAEAGECRPE